MSVKLVKFAQLITMARGSQPIWHTFASHIFFQIIIWSSVVFYVALPLGILFAVSEIIYVLYAFCSTNKFRTIILRMNLRTRMQLIEMLLRVL